MKTLYTSTLIVLTVVTNSCSNENIYPKSWSEQDRLNLIQDLNSSHSSIRNKIKSLNDAQWNWCTNSTSWSIAQVVEHLIVHDELFYREMRVLSHLPEFPAQPKHNFSSDDEILSYRVITAENIGSSPTYMEPRGRWCDKNHALKGFDLSRKALVDFITSTESNLREIYTESGRGPTKYRDLHQLMLISIAHTMRHEHQIRKILGDPGFPK